MDYTIIYLHDFFEIEKSPLETSTRNAAKELGLLFMRPFLYGEIGSLDTEEFKLKHVLSRIEPIVELVDFKETIIIITHDGSTPLFSFIKEYIKSSHSFIHISINPLWNLEMMRRELFRKGRNKITYKGEIEQELSKTILKEWNSILHLPKQPDSIIITDSEYDEMHNTLLEFHRKIHYSREIESLYYQNITKNVVEIIRNLPLKN